MCNRGLCDFCIIFQHTTLSVVSHIQRIGYQPKNTRYASAHTSRPRLDLESSVGVYVCARLSCDHGWIPISGSVNVRKTTTTTLQSDRSGLNHTHLYTRLLIRYIRVYVVTK